MLLAALFIRRCLKFAMPLVCGLCLSAPASSECECLWQGAFAQSASKADLVFTGTVVTAKGNAIDVQIDKVIAGTEFRETVRVWTDNGQLCRPAVSLFPVQSQWLLAAHKIIDPPDFGFNPHTPNISFGREQDYYLSSCGANWLRYSNGYVSGNLINGTRWQWDNEKMNPVLLELVEAYLNGVLPDIALKEAAKPQTAEKKLMQATRSFIDNQTN